MRVLVVEDEPTLREGLVDLLRADGHQVEAAGDGNTAIRTGLAEEFDVVLLDLMLPGVDGMEVCRRLREAKPDLGILMLTARGDEKDKVQGLRLGADDYVTKPFGAKELLARVASLGRRTARTTSPDLVQADGCTLDLGRCRAERGGDTQTLTARECNLLRFLLQHRERAVTRAEILEHVWHAPGDLQTRTVDMTVANLRQKIERDPRAPRIVVTVKGVGYAWGEDL